MRNLFSESLQTSLVTARRKYNHFPWPPLHLSSKQQGTHEGSGRRKHFGRAPLTGSAPAPPEPPGDGSNTPWNLPSSTMPALGQKPGSRLPHRALCVHLPTPPIAGTHGGGRGRWELLWAPQRSGAGASQGRLLAPGPAGEPCQGARKQERVQPNSYKLHLLTALAQV